MSRRDSNTEMRGVYDAAIKITKELEWVYRTLTPVDVGIDAVIEKCIEGDPCAKFIAVQIKSGAGNFYERKDSYTYYISKWHYHYWFSSNIPVIIVAHFPSQEKTIWEHITKDKVVRTKKRWQINIPKNKVLGRHSVEELSSIIDNSNQDDFYLNINPDNYTDENYKEVDDGVAEIRKGSNSLRNILDLYHGFGDSMQPINDEISKPKYLFISKNDIRVKRLVKDFARLITQLNNKVDKETEVFSSNASLGFRKYEKLLAINFACTQDVKSTIESLETIFYVSMNFVDAIRATKEFLIIIDNLPKDFEEINTVQKGLRESTESLLEEFIIVSDFMDNFILRVKSFMLGNF